MTARKPRYKHTAASAASYENKWQCRDIARESKADAGGYLQYMTQDVAGVILREWHTQIGKEVRRNRKLKNASKRTDFIVTDIGTFNIKSNDLAKKKGGFASMKG